jgi:hypothetical protein
MGLRFGNLEIINRNGFGRVVLVALDGGFAAGAQYNPAQLQIEESASWTSSANKNDNHPQLEYASTAPRTLSMELFFDTYEEPLDRRNVKRRFLDPLSQLVQVMDPKGTEERRRPPLVRMLWGESLKLDPFTGVIQALSHKLTMFDRDGTPLRATCAVKMMEAAQDSFGPRPVNRVAAPPPSGIPDVRR